MHSCGKYKIMAEIGKGTSGTVYQAIDQALERTVALKVLHPCWREEAVFYEKFRKNIHVLAQINHPNIARIYQIGRSEGAVYIASVFLSAGNLADRLTEKRFGILEARKVLQECAAGLEAVYPSGLIHQNIKPENILFNQRGEVVITDMGLTQIIGKAIEANHANAYTGISSPSYMAPELWNDVPASAASDVYALACIFCEMLSGRKLFAGVSAAATMKKHFDPVVLPPELPESLRWVLEKALAKDAKMRWQNAGAFVEALCAPENANPVKQGMPFHAQTSEQTNLMRELDEFLMALEEPQPDKSKEDAILSTYQAINAGDPAPILAHDVLEEPCPPTAAGVQMAVVGEGEMREVQKAIPVMAKTPQPLKPAAKKKPVWLWIGGGMFILALLCIVILIILGFAGYLGLENDMGVFAVQLTSTSTQDLEKTRNKIEADKTATKIFANAAATETAEITATFAQNILNIASNSFSGFTFGVDGFDDNCEVIELTNTISQKDIFMEERIYLASAFDDILLGEVVELFVYDADGKLIQQREWELVEDDAGCFWWPFGFDPHLPASDYKIDVVIQDVTIHSQDFTVTPYDISTIERPEYPPFTEFTFGRDGVNSKCDVIEQTHSAAVEQLDEDPFFYFASPYSMEDIGTKLSWHVMDEAGNYFFGNEREFLDVYDMCFWQGFSMEDELPGVYVLVIEFDNGITYTILFDIEG